MMRRRRKYKVGIQAPYHKLTEDAVKKIRFMHKNEAAVMAIARRFCVSPKTVRDIVHRHTWKHVR